MEQPPIDKALPESAPPLEEHVDTPEESVVDEEEAEEEDCPCKGEDGCSCDSFDPDRDCPDDEEIDNNITGTAIISTEATNPLYRPTRNVMDLITATGESKAINIRQPAHAFFNINSIDRYASVINPTSQFATITMPTAQQNQNPASNYQMSSQRNLLVGYFHRLTITDANLQWNIPTINSQNYILNVGSSFNTFTTVSAPATLFPSVRLGNFTGLVIPTGISAFTVGTILQVQSTVNPGNAFWGYVNYYDGNILVISDIFGILPGAVFTDFVTYRVISYKTLSLNVALTPGYYSYSQLATHLQERIIAVFHDEAEFEFGDLTVTWSSNTNSPSGFSYIFKTNDATKEIYFNTSFTSMTGVIPTTSIIQANRAMLKLYTMIGLTSNAMGVNNSNPAIYATATFPTLIYTSYIDIISSKLSQFMRVKDSETAYAPDTAVIMRIYLTNQGTITAPIVTGIPGTIAPTETFQEFAVGSRAFILNYTPTTPKNINWNPGQSIIDFDIRVVDEFGDQVPWSQFTRYGLTTELLYFTETFEFQLTVLASET